MARQAGQNRPCADEAFRHSRIGTLRRAFLLRSCELRRTGRPLFFTELILCLRCMDEKHDREGAGVLIANLQSSNVLYANLASIASVSRRRIGAIPCVGGM